MKNSDLLWQQLETDPENTTLKLILVDALIEDGERAEAEAVKWCVENGKWPTRTASQSPWWGSATELVFGLDDRFDEIMYCIAATNRDHVLLLRDRLIELGLIEKMESTPTLTAS